MATLFLPASPSLFPVERPPMEEDGDNDSIPELRLSSEDAAKRSANVSDSGMFAARKRSSSRLETTLETEESADDSNTPDTSMDTSVADEDDNASAAVIIGEVSTFPSQAGALDQEMNQALMEDDGSTLDEITIVPGGLNNLGNTCYMASAIQMLASLDPLMDHLLAQNKQQQQTNSQESSLLDAFLQLVARLRQGETVRPYELKEVLDEKSPLFCGYDQQDAHEFITTLLDILDEEYKKQQQQDSENEDEANDSHQAQVGNNDNEYNDTKENPSEDENVSANDGASSTEDQLDSGMDLETEQEGYVLVSRTPERVTVFKEETESPSKRFKPDRDVAPQEEEQEVEEDESEQTVPRLVTRSSASSFSELNVDEIGLLLHGTPGPGLIVTSCGGDMPSASGPKYKLVGGRMSMNADRRYESVTTTSVMDLVPENNEDDNDASPSETVLPSEDSQQNSSFSAERVSLEENRRQEKKPVSPVESYLSTETRVRLTCDSCKYTRTHKETFWHLSLELENSCTSANSVQDGLARFFAPEQRQLKCEKCFCETATQTMQITKLPTALLLHFKRFIVEVSDDYSSISYRKNTSLVSFESRMSVREHKLEDDDASFVESSSSNCVLSDFLAPDCILPKRSDYLLRPCCGGGLQIVSQQSEFTLKSVVNHIGSSASCGHYTADGLRKTRGSEKQWLRFNDSYVSRISVAQAVEEAASTAYMVLYEME